MTDLNWLISLLSFMFPVVTSLCDVLGVSLLCLSISLEECKFNILHHIKP